MHLSINSIPIEALIYKNALNDDQCPSINVTLQLFAQVVVDECHHQIQNIANQRL
jgi:hypothetical protein